MKIVFFGTPKFIVPVLMTLQKNFDLVGVVTAPDKKVGRKQILTPSPIKQAVTKPLLLLTPDKLDEEVVEKLAQLSPDLFVIAAYGKIIPQAVLNIPKFGALNIHPSLLPYERGASPIQAAILSGNEKTGVSIIRMDERMDHGPIVFTKEVSLSDTDTFETLSKKMFGEAVQILPKVIEDFVSGKIKPQEQNHEEATFNKLIKKENGFFEINNPPAPEILDRMIRAYSPWPGVWTKWNNKIVKFYPGGLVQMEGKNKVKLENFLHGYPDFPLKKI